MLNIFKRKNITPEIVEDEIFGKLSYVKATSNEASYLLGSKIFTPLNSEIEYQIYSEDKIVTQEQKFLLNEIENKYLELRSKIEEFINSEIEKINTESNKYNLTHDLELSLISIPKKCSTPIQWSVEYTVNKDFALFSIEFRDWTPYWFSISA